MPADRTPRKMDQPYTDWSPLPARPPLTWPDGKRIALCIIVNFEHYDWPPPSSAVVPPSAVKFSGFPHDASHHEYGNRVGIFRVMAALDRYGIRATAAWDAALAERNPFLLEQCKMRSWEIIGHGITFTRMINESMTEDVEREYLARALDTVADLTGARPMGWIGTDYGESSRTVALLSELGVRYVCDWANDDQPYRLNVPSGSMVALPTSADLDDVRLLRAGIMTVQTWAQMVLDAFDTLYDEAGDSGRVLVLNLHPYLIGQPFRVRYLEGAVSAMMRRRDAIWLATGNEIAEWCAKQL